MRIGTGERRTLALGVSCILGILLLGRVMPATVRWSNDRVAESRALEREWHQASIALKAASHVRDSARVRGLRLGEELASLLHGSTPSARAASLAELLQDAANSTGIRLGSIDLRADTTGSRVYAFPRASTEVVGDVTGIAAFLARLETTEVRLRIVSLKISQVDPFASEGQPEALQVSMVIEGVARRPLRAITKAKVRG